MDRLSEIVDVGSWDALIQNVRKYGRQLSRPFFANNLSEPVPELKTVTFYRDVVLEFARDYNTLVAFAAVICDKRPEHPGDGDLDRHIQVLRQRAEEASRR